MKHFPLFVALLTSLMAFGPTFAAAEKGKLVRQWTSSEGKAMQAELLEFDDKEIKVKLAANFSIVKIPLERLSEADRTFVMDMVAKRKKDASLKEGAYATQVQGSFVKAVSKLGLNYQFYGNPEWDGTKRYPLVIWLHGSGQSGSDNQAQMGGATGIFTNKENQAERPCFFLSPQCPDAAIGWNKEVAGKLMTLIADLVEKLPVDPARIYLTGSSMGGFGAWSLAAKYPDIFACAVPLCGGGDPKTAEAVKNVPVWAWHGDLDPMVPIERDRVIVDALKAINGNVKFTELTGEGHNIAGIVYGKPELHYWMFEQRKGAAPSTTSASAP